jgi:hypothetical protein
VADKPKPRDFDSVMDELREELRAHEAAIPRLDGRSIYLDGSYKFPKPTIEIMQRYVKALDVAKLMDRAGDISLLRDPAGNLAETVPLRKAEKYSGVTDRQIRRLIHDQSLQAVGSKGNRRITTESLLKLFPPRK